MRYNAIVAAALCTWCFGIVAFAANSAEATSPTEERNTVIPVELNEVQVKTSPAQGLKDEKWNRQDPSNILRINDTYHVWYARHPQSKKWNETRTERNVMQICMATSVDGHQWKEHGPVLPPSRPGEWHERATHAPHVVPWEGKYYLFFSAFNGPYSREKRTGRKCLGLAVADRPGGPYKHVGDEPILAPSKDQKAFDHYLIDDPCVIRREGKFYLYYKGRNSNTSQCWLGAAAAKDITGPYRRVQAQPVCEANWHTGCVWPHRNGVAGIIDSKNIAYSPDGLHFERGSKIPRKIRDAGVFCPDAFSEAKYRQGITWGLSLGGKPLHIFRFDMHLRAPAVEPGEHGKPSNKPDAGDGK